MPGALDLPDLESRSVTPGTGTGAVNLHYLARGEAPLILFLHGFPQYWYAWRHQLADFGNDHRTVALDLRGYNESDQPEGRDAYRMHLLVEDVAEAIRQLAGPHGKATLVGHDWGGVIAWVFAHPYPELLDRLVTCNAPHPARMRGELKHPSQLLKSWSMLFLQLPVLPEAVMTARGREAVRRAVRGSLVDKASVTDEEIDHYRPAFGKPGVATASINYYRNFISRRGLRRPPRLQRLDVPTLLIWGEQDRALGVSLATCNEPFVKHLTVRRLPEAGHFVQEERPQVLDEAIRAYSRCRRRHRRGLRLGRLPGHGHRSVLGASHHFHSEIAHSHGRADPNRSRSHKSGDPVEPASGRLDQVTHAHATSNTSEDPPKAMTQ